MSRIVTDSDSFTIVNPSSIRQKVRLFGAAIGNPYEGQAEEPPAWSAVYSSSVTPTGIIFNPTSGNVYMTFQNGLDTGVITLNGETLSQTQLELHSNVYEETIIGVIGVDLLRRENGTGDWYQINTQTGVETFVGTLPLGAVTNDIDPTTVKTFSDKRYKVTLTPSSGLRQTEIQFTDNSYTTNLPSPGRGSITTDANGNVLVHDSSSLYKLSTTPQALIKESRNLFNQYAQLPAMCKSITCFAQSIEQLFEPIKYGSEGRNFEEEAVYMPSSQLSTMHAQKVTTLQFPEFSGPILDGFHYLDMAVLPNSQLTLLFKYNRIAHGLQGKQYYRRSS